MTDYFLPIFIFSYFIGLAKASTTMINRIGEHSCLEMLLIFHH